MSGTKRARSSPEQPGGPGKMPNLQRSPSKSVDQWQQQLEMIKGLFERQSEEMKQAEERQANRITESEERIKAALDKRVALLEQKVDEVQKENVELKVVNGELATRILQLEREICRCNIVASGLDFETPNEGFKMLNEVLHKATNRAVVTEGIRTFSLKDGSKKIVARCKNEIDKRIIFAKKKSLETQRDGKSLPVYINNDLPRDDRDVQRHLRIVAKEKRAGGSDVKLSGNRLMIDGKWYEWNKQEQKVTERNFRS